MQIEPDFQWGWRLFQAGIFMVVFSANIYWGIEENPYAVGIIALALAIVLTWIVGKMSDLIRYGLGWPRRR